MNPSRFHFLLGGADLEMKIKMREIVLPKIGKLNYDKK